MFEIEAHYHDRKIYLSDGREYPLGEILLCYFSVNIKELEDVYDVCKRAKSHLNISSEYQPYAIGERAQKVEDVYERIFDIVKKLPPYDKQHFRRGVLQNLFAYYDDLFVNYYRGQKYNEDDDDYYFIDRSEGVDDGYISENLNELKRLPDYHLDDEKALNDSEKKQYAIEFISHIRMIADEFETFVADLLRVKNVFMPFADELCDHNNYPAITSLYTFSVQGMIILEYLIITKPQGNPCGYFAYCVIWTACLFQQILCSFVYLLLDELQSLTIEIIP